MTGWLSLWIVCLVVLLVCGLLLTPARLHRWAGGDQERFTALLRWRTLLGIAAAVAMVPVLVAIEVSR